LLLIKLKNSKSFYQWCYDNLPKKEADIVISRWDYELNVDKNGIVLSPKDVSYGSDGFDKRGYWFKCFEYLEHDSEQKRIGRFTSGKKGSIICNQCNMVAITHPHLVIYLVNKEDAYKYSMGTSKKLLMKCPDCGHEKQMLFTKLIQKGFSCARCSDHIPYSQKFMFAVLEQLKLIFKTELSKRTFKWCGKYRYDFYIDKINCIIETHGLQHYEQSTGSWSSVTLKETQDNDKQKEELAQANGIKEDNYIILDCRKPNLKWIKNSIMKSNLPNILNFKEDNIDWFKCHEFACNSLVKKVCDLWETGIKNALKIAEILKFNRNTIIKYLKQGAELGWCDYSTFEAREQNYILAQERNCVKTVCVTTKEIFNSQNEACDKYNITHGRIYSCCIGKTKSAGTHPDTGEKLIWMYYDDYVLKTDNEIENIIKNKLVYKNCKKVICLTTLECFDKISDVVTKYNINKSHIGECCRGMLKSAGKHPITNEPLKWMFYDEYINNQSTLQSAK